MSNPKGKRNCSVSDEATGRGHLQKDASFKTILLSKSTNPDNKLDNQTLTKSDCLDKLSIKIIESPKKQSCVTAESTDSKMLQSEKLVLEKEMEKLKLKNESLTIENNLLTEVLKKRKCHYPKCDGQGNTNKKNNSHWSISYCPLFKKEQESKESNVKIISDLRAELRSQQIESANILESLKLDLKAQLIQKDKDFDALKEEKKKLQVNYDSLRIELDKKFQKMSDLILEKDKMIFKLLDKEEGKLSIYTKENAEDSFDLF